MNEEEKGKIEIEVFIRFTNLTSIDFDMKKVAKSFPPNPDIYTEIKKK